jgi:hypothetical protein
MHPAAVQGLIFSRTGAGNNIASKLGFGAAQGAAAALSDDLIAYASYHPELTREEVLHHVLSGAKWGTIFGGLHAGEAKLRELWEKRQPPCKGPGKSSTRGNEEQQIWLEQKAHAAGYSSLEDMQNKAPDLYKNLTGQWRVSHPEGHGAILQQTSINAINEKLFGKSPASPTEGNVYGTGKTESHRGTSSSDAGGGEGDHLKAGADIAGGSYRPAPAAGGGLKAQSREEITRAIQQRVVDWARDRRLLVDKLPPEWTPNGPNDLGGVEHHVFDAGDRLVKVTKPGAWGLYPKPLGKDDWSMGDGNLTNYLQRLVDQRSETGSDIRLHGILSDPRTRNLQVITSQPTWKGDPVDEDYIQKSMHAQGYQQIDGPGNYYNPKTNKAVLDLHDLNAVRQGNVLLPFDVIVMQPAGQLKRIFESRSKPIQQAKLNDREEKSAQGDSLHSAPLFSCSRKLKGRAVLDHLPDHLPATPQECYALLRQAVAVYQNLYPALWRRFRRGSTSGRSGLETQFRDASGRITPEAVRDARISVQEDKLARDLRGLSPRQTVFHMEHALGEEVRHLASLYAALGFWEHSGTPMPLEPWLTGYFSHLWQRDFTSPLRTAILHAYAGNYGDPSRGNKMTYLPQDWQLAFEGLRMLSQARAGTLPTEADQLWHWPQHATYPLPMLIYFVKQAALGGKLSPRIKWMLHAIAQIMDAWHQSGARQRPRFPAQGPVLPELRCAA